MSMEAEKTPPIFKQMLLLGIVTIAIVVCYFIIEISYYEWGGGIMNYTNYILPFTGVGAIVVLAIVGMAQATKNGGMARVLGIIILIAAILVALVGGNMGFSNGWNAIMTIKRMGYLLDANNPTTVFYLVVLLHVSIVMVILALMMLKRGAQVMKLTAGYKKAAGK